mmetsp:Transcript_16528/g.47447  ORF Transcript_16528/g.47447 Transcript_16528/m.47447 type:complete len:288 (+) Transcript_16528:331-1194(+)
MNFWFPSQLLLGGGNVWLPLSWIVGNLGKVNDLRIRLGHCLNLLRKVLDAVLVGIAKVDRPFVGTIHELHQTLDEIRHVLEGPCLRAIAVDGNVLPLQSLDDEIAHDAAIIGVHARSERIENARNANLDVVLVLVRIHHGLGHALALVVASTGSQCVDVSPIGFGLRVNRRVSVDFRRRCQQHTGLDALGKAEHVEGAHRTGLDGLDGIVLIVRRTGRTCEVVDLINLQEYGLRNVVSHQAEVGVVHPVLHILLVAREEVVQNDDFVALHHELVDQVAANKPSAAGD